MIKIYPLTEMALHSKIPKFLLINCTISVFEDSNLFHYYATAGLK